MKKGFLCILLSLLLVTPLFVGCNNDSTNIGTEAIVYTLYTICEEGTTEEAITEVELALNRLLFYRLDGIMVKLEMVTEDEYDELIAEKYAEVKEYQDEIMNGDTSTEESETFITGDEILKNLENGEEIPLDEPRLDIFLVRGYDEYFELVDNGDVQEIDTVLDDYGKALKANIHGTLFNAARINNKLYGVPVNHAIDQYTYLVFDNDYMNDINPGTVSSLKDLEDYLAAVKETAPDVVPLKNVVPSNSIFHLFYEGSPFLADNTTAVKEAYKSGELKNYFAMIAKYKELGYLGNENDAEGTEYAVHFEKGDIEELKETYPESDYTIVEYSAPVATNHSVLSTDPATIGNIFCISKFVASNELTHVVRLLNALNTDPELMNILLYGVENEHYILTEKGQVKRERQDYIIDPNNIGNAFVARTPYVEGVNNENIWLNATKQNQDSIASPALGFAPSNIKFSYMDGEETIEFSEPDYFAAIQSVTDKYYKKLLAGELDFDYNEIYNRIKNEEFQKVADDLIKHYDEKVLRPLFETEVRNSDTISSMEDELRTEAENVYMSQLFDSTKTNWEINLANEYREKNPDATDEQVNTYVAETLTDDFVNTKIKTENDDKYLKSMIETTYQGLVDAKITEIVDGIAQTPRYLNQRAALLSSQRYADDLADNRMIAEQQTIPNKVNAEIVALIQTQIIDPMMEEIEVAIKTCVETFFEENKELLGYEEIDSLYIEIGYYVDKTPEAPEGSEEPVEPVFGPEIESWYEFVYTKKVSEPYKAVKEAAA